MLPRIGSLEQRKRYLRLNASHLPIAIMPTIHDADLVAFLKWALPTLGYRWEGFRKVRSQVKSCISERLDELGLGELSDYRRRLDRHLDEWERLDACCRITISRFYRDATTWDGIRRQVLPQLADTARTDGRDALHALSIGSASGEEPYTLRLCWELDDERPWEGLELHIRAFDAADHMVERARRARYPRGNLKELPDEWIDCAFDPVDGDYRLRPEYRRGVSFTVADLRDWQPPRPHHFDIAFCRNLAFMYFDEAGRNDTLEQLAHWTRPGAALVVGNRDVVPDRPELFLPWPDVDYTYRRTGP